MKKIALAIAGIVAIALAIVAAFQTGEKSPVLVSGQVEVTEALSHKTQGLRTLYAVVYDLDSQIPMPYGAVRFRLQQDLLAGQPFEFLITREKLQLMPASENQPLPRRMRLKLRLDQDGLGGRDQPGDITGERRPVMFGEKVLVSLDTLVKAQ